MYLHEYQSKPYFKSFGIPTLQGTTATSPQMASSIAAGFGVPVVVNAQTLADQRVFRVANTPEEAGDAASELLAMTIHGVRVRTLLIEPAADIVAQYFLGIYADRGSSLLMLASTEGGSDIAEIERGRRETLSRELIDPFLGVLEFQGRNLANGINLPREQWSAFIRIAQNLHRCCVACDAVRGEINPLGLTRGGELIALGGKLVIDDNALFRQPELTAIRDVKGEHESALQAHSAGFTYVPLSGTIACVVSGAGLGMATMDLLARHGAQASCFLDLGGDVQRDRISAALGLILPEAEAVLFNIFADKADCAAVAQEIMAAVAETQPTVPVVIRLAGQEADQGQAAVEASTLPHLIFVPEMIEAVRVVTKAAARGNPDVRSGG